jgi:hypothetical protein
VIVSTYEVIKSLLRVPVIECTLRQISPLSSAHCRAGSHFNVLFVVPCIVFTLSDSLFGANHTSSLLSRNVHHSTYIAHENKYGHSHLPT